MTDDGAPERRFQSFTSMKELAEHLEVPEEALYCAEIKENTKCRKQGCIYPALEKNRGWCCLHSKTWYPREPSRGHKLLGLSFMRPVEGTSGKSRNTCCCDLRDCEGIGYALNMFRIPKEPAHVVEDVMYCLNIRDKEKKDAIRKDPSSYRIAPWHFHPSQRALTEHDDGGRWMLTENFKYVTKGGRKVYVDSEGKKWYDYPPAVHTIVSIN